MLNVVASILARKIFTATPSSLAEVGLDAMLSRLMDNDPQQERLLRAIILAWSPQELTIDTDKFAKWVADAFGCILAAKARGEMELDLKKLFELTHSWNELRRSRCKIVVTLDENTYHGSWKSYLAPVPAARQRTQIIKQSPDSDLDDDHAIAFLGFPSVVAIHGDTWETIHPGILIHHSQVKDAQIEWRKEHKRRRFSRSSVPHETPRLPF